jgi:hypothetical protein
MVTRIAQYLGEYLQHNAIQQSNMGMGEFVEWLCSFLLFLFDQRMVSLFSRLAWYNIGYIEWQPWLPQVSEIFYMFIFTENSYLIDLYTNTA